VQTEILQALAVTAELTGTEFSPSAARMLAADLEGYDPQQILGALKRIRRDGVRVNEGNIIARLEDGRPGAEEAWAMLPRDESGSTAMTEEMAEAMGVALPLLAENDQVAARMAFKETYARLLNRAREQKTPVRWFLSLGTDPASREAAAVDAARKGRLAIEQAIAYVPFERQAAALAAMGVTHHPLLASNPAGQQRLAQELRQLKHGH
jgi:hypothetical protein